MRKTVLIFILLLAFGCKNTKSPDVAQAGTNDTVKVETKKFTYPKIPVMLTDREQQLSFYIQHYWDHFDFADTTYVTPLEVAEQAWVDYIDLLCRAPLDKAQEEMKAMMSKSVQQSKKVFLYFVDLANKYLYDPNSPMLNEELYIPILEVMIETPVLSDSEKMLPKNRLEWAHKNRVGTKAINFEYTDIKGKTGTLYQVKADCILLFFNNPGCSSCKEHIEAIRNSIVLNKLLSSNRLKIMSIYPENNAEEWKEHYGNYPAEWINGYNKSQTIDKKYNLRAIPTLYLLDKNKTVLLKDAPFGQIENYLLTF